jgi:hypothetical protein
MDAPPEEEAAPEEEVAPEEEEETAAARPNILCNANFAIFIFGMRHPDELRDLLNNPEAVQRAQDGAEDGGIPDPDEAMPNAAKL